MVTESRPIEIPMPNKCHFGCYSMNENKSIKEWASATNKIAEQMIRSFDLFIVFFIGNNFRRNEAVRTVSKIQVWYLGRVNHSNTEITQKGTISLSISRVFHERRFIFASWKTASLRRKWIAREKKQKTLKIKMLLKQH